MNPPTATVVTEIGRATQAGRISKTIAYYVAFIVLGLRLGSLGPTLPGLAEQTYASLSEVSSLFITHALGYLIGSLQGGKWYDRLPGHRVMASVIFAMVLITAIVPLLPSIWLLNIAFLILGIAEATVDVGGNTLCVWVHRKKVGPVLNGLYFFVAFGAFFSPLIVAQMVSMGGGIRLAYWVLSLLILPAAFLLLLLPSPAIRKAPEGESRGKLNNGLMIGLISFFLFLTVGSSVGLDSWIYTYTLKLGLGTETTAAYLNSAFWAFLFLGRLMTIPVVARLEPSAILFIDLFGSLICLLIIVLWPNSIIALIAGTCGLGFSMASLSPATFALAERTIAVTGRVAGWFVAGISLGCLLIPWVIGQLFESIGPQVMMFAILIAIFVATVDLVVLVVHSKRPATDAG